MTRPIISFHNIETNESSEREMTEAEFKIYEKDNLILETKAKAEADKAAAKQSAQAKLAALGLSADEVAAILGN